MPRPLVFLLGDQELALNLIKVERSKLYGFKDVEAVDEEDAVCDLATLADDGRTLIGRGGTGIGWLDADGKWCEKADLRPVDIHGDPIIPVESSFGQPIKLFDTATPQDMLDCNVRLVYCLEPVDESSSLEDLNAELKKGTIFCFPYSYRGGLYADVAFLLHNAEGKVMLTIGDQTQSNFVGIQSQILVDDDADAEGASEEEDDISFDMI